MGKKKMSKEEKKRFEAEKAEILRIEMEKERFFIHFANRTTTKTVFHSKIVSKHGL